MCYSREFSITARETYALPKTAMPTNRSIALLILDRANSNKCGILFAVAASASRHTGLSSLSSHHRSAVRSVRGIEHKLCSIGSWTIISGVILFPELRIYGPGIALNAVVHMFIAVHAWYLELRDVYCVMDNNNSPPMRNPKRRVVEFRVKTSQAICNFLNIRWFYCIKQWWTR